MTGNEFLKKLSAHLKKMPKEEQDEIIADFKEHIDFAVKQGFTPSGEVHGMGVTHRLVNPLVRLHRHIQLRIFA